MSMLPPVIEKLVSKLREEPYPLSWLEVDDTGLIQSSGGDLVAFAMDKQPTGHFLSEFGIYLEEMFPQREEPFKLVDLELRSGTYSTVYIQTIDSSNWIILQDHTLEAAARQHRKQVMNDTSLPLAKETSATRQIDICSAFDMLIMERLDDGTFCLLEPPPAAFRQVYPEVFVQHAGLRPDLKFPFVEYFMDDAVNAWANGRRAKSGPWLETGEEGDDIAIMASATLHQTKQLLVLELLGDSYEDQHNFLQLGRENTLIKEYLEEEVHKRTLQIREREEEIALRLVWAAESRDAGETGAHIRRLGLYSETMAQALGWDKERCYEIRLAATMHDIGKIGIPDSILRKPGSLDMNEFEIMKTHTTIGGRILAGSTSGLLHAARSIALSHHEKWDGTGYPNGLSGDEIPIEARIVSIADVFDALVHKRVYKAAWPIDEAIKFLVADRESRFDPDLIDLFLELSAQFREISENTTAPIFDGYNSEDDQFF